MPRFSRAIRSFALASASACALPCLALGADQPAPVKADPPMMSMGGVNAPKSDTAGQPTINGDGKASTALTLDLRKYDFPGTKANSRMYMPESVALSPDKPGSVKKEPAYVGKVNYATIHLGDAAPGEFVIAIDQPETGDATIHPDLNGDGDLTNDDAPDWETKADQPENGGRNYQGTWTFTPGYKSADGGAKLGQYALNLYWAAGRQSLNYYNASARVGKIDIGGKTYDVTLIENDADGLFNKLYDASKPIIVGEKMTKPVWLLLDGDQFDIRGTFGFGDMNYLATVSDDGSTLAMTPTMKVVRVPRVNADKTAMLDAGVAAPDFEAIVWKPGSTALDTSSRFKLSDYRGKKIVVLDMWATWCGPCMKGIPHLSKVAEALKGQDVEVIALNTSDDAEPFERFAKGKGAEYKFMLARDPAGRDENGNTIARKLYGVTGIPATFVIDKSGKIVGTVSGYTEGDMKLEQILKGLNLKVD